MVCHIETIIVGVVNKLQQLMLTLSNMEHKTTLADFNLSVYYFSRINYSRQTIIFVLSHTVFIYQFWVSGMSGLQVPRGPYTISSPVYVVVTTVDW